jgi:hypothetical protein
MNKAVSLKIASSLFLFSAFTVTHAEPFSYNYIDLGVNSYDIEGIRSYKLEGSVDTANNVNFLAGYSNTAVRIDNFKLDINQYKLSVGMYNSVSDNFDLTAEVGALNVEMKTRFASGSETGLLLGAGFRKHMTDRLETHGGFELIALDGDSSAEYTVGGRFNFSENFAAGLSYTISGEEGDDVFTGSVRMQFL